MNDDVFSLFVVMEEEIRQKLFCLAPIQYITYTQVHCLMNICLLVQLSLLGSWNNLTDVCVHI